MALIPDPVAGLEALKRAVFLQWYELCEPACFSGVSALDDAARRDCLLAVDRLCRQSVLDEELSWMLPWYFLVADFAFTGFGELPATTAMLSALDPKGWESASPPGDLLLRGQMGEYWQSLFDNLSPPRSNSRPADQ